MRCPQWYAYKTDDGYEYELGIEYVWTGRSAQVLGADIYNTKREYMGYWDNFQMTMPLLWQLRIFAEKHHPRRASPR